MATHGGKREGSGRKRSDFPSQDFINDFNLAMQYYECTLDEVRFEKQRCVANMRDAEINYHHVAKNIRLLFGDKLK